MRGVHLSMCRPPSELTPGKKLVAPKRNTSSPMPVFRSTDPADPWSLSAE